MAKNFWYVIAFSCVVSVITLNTENLFLFCLFIVWLLFLFYRKKVTMSLLSLALISLLFFYFYLPPTTLSILSEDKVKEQYTGIIDSPVTITEQKIEFILKETNRKDPILVLHFLDAEENRDTHQFLTLRYGATCTVEGVLERPAHARNPYQFDYEQYLHKKGITNQLILDSLDSISCEDNSFFEYLYSFRMKLIKLTSDKLHPETASWLHALVLGDDSLLDTEIIELFQRWSLSHILAISGLHIGIIVAILYVGLVRFSITTKERANWFLIIFLPIYAVMAGGQPSVWRASLMVLFISIIQKAKIKINYTDGISIIFLFLVLFDKYIIYHIGFQLSFAVTFGLILSQKWIANAKSNIERIFQISFISQMVILPLQVHYFLIFQPLSILLNVIVVPYFSLFVIPFMFSLLFLSFLPDPLVDFMEDFFIFIHQIVLWFIQKVDSYLNYPLLIGDFPFYYVCIYYLLFVLMMVNLENFRLIRSFRYGLCLIVFLIFLSLRPFFSPVGTVTMLDIGQGDAFIIELPYRKGVFIIDAGASFSFHDFAPTDRVYKQIIRPYLQGRGIYKIDTIFLSHNDLDHSGSMSYILEEIKVDEVVINEYHALQDEEIDLINQHQITLTIAKFNEIIERKGQLFQVLSPKTDKNDENENSLVIYTSLGGKGWLFVGDIGKETERSIINYFPKLHIDVLKVGHHGSNTSTDTAFIQHTKPDYALISAGVNNRYGHPTKEVLQTLNEQAVIVYRTDLQGAVQYHFIGTNGIFKSFIEE